MSSASAHRRIARAFVDAIDTHGQCSWFLVLELASMSLEPVEGVVKAVVAVVAAAQAGFQDLVDGVGLDVVPGVREQLIVEDRLAAIERGQLDDRACRLLDLWLRVFANKCGYSLCTHGFTGADEK